MGGSEGEVRVFGATAVMGGGGDGAAGIANSTSASRVARGGGGLGTTSRLGEYVVAAGGFERETGGLGRGGEGGGFSLGSPAVAAAAATATASEALNLMAAERQRAGMSAMGVQETRRQERIADLKRLLVEMNTL